MTDTADLERDEPLIHSISALREDVLFAEEGDLVTQLESAHQRAIEAARERVGVRLGIDIEDDDEIRLGGLRDYRPEIDWSAALYQLLAQTFMEVPKPTRSDAKQNTPAAWLRAGELRRELAHEELRATRLMTELDDGWMLLVADPSGLDPTLEELIVDLRLAFGAVQTTLFFGIRSALGPPPSPAEDPRIIVQVAGRRSVLIQGDRQPHEQQHRVQSGAVVFAPRGRPVTHLPLDADTAHVEIRLPQLGARAEAPTREERDAQARTSVVALPSFVGARLALAGSSTTECMFRLLAPGGLHVVAAPADTSPEGETEIAFGDMLVRSSRAAAELLVHLAEGVPMSAEMLAEAVGVSCESVERALTQLWQAELLMPFVPTPGPTTNDRLTQVASGEVGITLAESVLSAVDSEAWRAPRVGELPMVDGVDVVVQPLVSNEAISQMNQVVHAMNAQFFAADLVGLSADDPPLVVRVQPGEPIVAGLEGLATELLAPFSTRKITWVLALTDADGGWPTLPAGSPASADGAGTASAWLSLRPWTLSPLIDGERLFLLGRHHGPAFR